ncbi:hypothetical protein NSPZN2_40181 [Nitrospira defluvii]|uniref:Uncharacterized protein n=1 Tax=Nitrospira defluvii TaxID=330214 RepID=A0ABM8RSF1_9BACT|nr:hypothetical protein NSPZN2_40181 [Nitrospira defluvii]
MSNKSRVRVNNSRRVMIRSLLPHSLRFSAGYFNRIGVPQAPVIVPEEPAGLLRWKRRRVRIQQRLQLPPSGNPPRRPVHG